MDSSSSFPFPVHFTHPLLRPGLVTILLATVLAYSLIYAADAPAGTPSASPADTKAGLIKQVAYDAAFYQRLQLNPDTVVPNWVVAQSKGVLILERWPGAPTLGENGQGIGMLKGLDRKFGAPAFYMLGDATIGLQTGPASVHLVVFLMSDKALLTLTDHQFSWNGNLTAVAGNSSSTAAPVGLMPDVILFQKAGGLDPVPMAAAITLSENKTNNAFFYGKPGITLADILYGKVKMPKAAAPLVDAFNQQAGMPN
jgi:lipid-binding SYLF domain-containing protein